MPKKTILGVPARQTSSGKTIPVPGTKKKGKAARGRKQRPAYQQYRDGTALVKVGKSTVAMLNGEYDVTQWSLEELIRGAPMQITRPPKLIPLEVHQELARRVTSESRHHMAAELEYAVKKHMEIIKAIDPAVPTGPQMKAIEMLYDRTMGQPEQHIVLEPHQKWLQALNASIVVNEEEAAKIIDVEPVQAKMEEES